MVLDFVSREFPPEGRVLRLLRELAMLLGLFQSHREHLHTLKVAVDGVGYHLYAAMMAVGGIGFEMK